MNRALHSALASVSFRVALAKLVRLTYRSNKRGSRNFGHGLLHRMVAVILVIRFAMPSVELKAVETESPHIEPAVVRQDYDGNGNLVQRVDANGAITIFEYDSVNRLVSIDYPGGEDPDVRFTYDVNGNRTSMIDWTGRTSFEYDLFDRLTGIDYPNGGFVWYDYDPVGNITDLRYGHYSALEEEGAFTHVHYEFDADNRITSVLDVHSNQVATYEYDAVGNPAQRVLPNGVMTQYGYDRDGRLISVLHQKSDGTLIVKYDYLLNADGNRLQMTESSTEGVRVTRYTYDLLDRLDTVRYPDDRLVDYDYDSFGNRVRQTSFIHQRKEVRDYVYDLDNRLLRTLLDGNNEEEFTYDGNGNLTQRYHLIRNRIIDYAYDFENRLVSYYDGTTRIQYAYDGLGRRISRSNASRRTFYLNDPNVPNTRLLEEQTYEGSPLKSLIWGNDLVGERESGSDNPVHFLSQDFRGSITKLLDAQSQVVAQYEYDAFGSIDLVDNTEEVIVGFQAAQQEIQSNLVYMRARYFDVSLGRFLTPDPHPGQLTLPGSINPYVFALNNPVNNSDPSGQTPAVPVMLGIATVGGFINAWSEGWQRWSEGSRGWLLVSDIARGYASGFAGSFASIYRIPGVTELSDQLISSAQNLKWGLNVSNILTSATTDLLMKGLTSKLNLKASVGDRLISDYSANNGVVNPSAWIDQADRIEFFQGIVNKPVSGFIKGGVKNTFDWMSRRFSLPGGVALNKSATALLDINKISGATYDPKTGQILIYGLNERTSRALPPMNIDDLAVAFRAISQGTMPVVSIEDPMFDGTPEWGGQSVYTVRYGPFFTDPIDGIRKVRDVSSKTHFGWVMFDADRHMKSLSLGADNRTQERVFSNVNGYMNAFDLSDRYWEFIPSEVKTRYWFNPKEIVIEPSLDGKSMELTRAEMQLSTETMFASNGQVENTPDAEYFANWFTRNYDAVAQEQITLDDEGNRHQIFKELKQLAAIVGIVKWAVANDIPVDWSFLDDYVPEYYDSAPNYTPVTKGTHTIRDWFSTRTISIIGGVNYCHDLDFGLGGTPDGLAQAALESREEETDLAWKFRDGNKEYSVSAISVDRTEKSGGFSYSTIDASYAIQGAAPLQLERHFDSFNVHPTALGWGWQFQPYSLEFRGEPTRFNLCNREWEGYGEVYFLDRRGKAAYKYIPSGIYDNDRDPLDIARFFIKGEDILVYRFETKEIPGLMFSDNQTGMLMRLADGTHLFLSMEGELRTMMDRNGNRIRYHYQEGRLTEISQPEGRSIQLQYDRRGLVVEAELPEGDSVRYLYDRNDDLVAAQRSVPTGWRMQYGYDDDHNLQDIRDENGDLIERRQYDVYGRVTSVTQPGIGAPLQQHYNLSQKTSRVSGPQGYQQSLFFDENHDLTEFQDARGSGLRLQYNSYRDVTQATSGDDSVHRYYYDSKGNLIGTVKPNDRADMAFFNLNGDPVVTFHTLMDEGFISSFDREHVLSEYQGEAYVANYTKYDYDEGGNLTSLKDANNHTTQFGYDDHGNRIWAKDARGFKTDFEFDALSRMLSVRNQLGHRISYEYDARDNLTSIKTHSGVTENAYNSKNQLTSITTGDPEQRKTTHYTYDSRGQIETVTDPAGFSTRYRYDVRGNLIEIEHDGVVRFRYEYDELNRLVATHYQGTVEPVRPSIIPINPNGGERLDGDVTIAWQSVGDWGDETSILIQYSKGNGMWNDIANVSYDKGQVVWHANEEAGGEFVIRFVYGEGGNLTKSQTPPFILTNATRYYVNDASVDGDEYALVGGRPYQASVITGLSPNDPVDSIQAIVDHYTLKAGDIIYIDTGEYLIHEDIVITGQDAGKIDNPIRIQGPTGSGRALIKHSDAFNSLGCLRLMETHGIQIERLQLTGGSSGVFLLNSFDCVIRDNDCFENGYAGNPGQDGFGAGIQVAGEGFNMIQGNRCYLNGGRGGAGDASQQNGGDGYGVGISLESSSFNRVLNNECYGNSGIGGLAFTASARTGYSQGIGISVETIDANFPAEDNHILDNHCFENKVFAPYDIDESRIPAPGGDAWAQGIAVLKTFGTRVEGNTINDNLAWAGRSFNGLLGQSGGNAFGYGIYGKSNSEFIVTRNKSYSNAAIGEFGVNDSEVLIGRGWSAGIYLEQCPLTLIGNNLCYLNHAETYGTFDDEMPGDVYCSGVELNQSPGCKVLNNTLVQNYGDVRGVDGANQFNAFVAEVYLWNGSTDVKILNNIVEVRHPDSFGILVESGNEDNLQSDHNLVHVFDDGLLGAWGETVCDTLVTWQEESGHDHLSVDQAPLFFDPQSSDFHLTNSSPAIDAGMSLTEIRQDIDGETRPATSQTPDHAPKFDIGFDEFKDSDGDGLSDVAEYTWTNTKPDVSDTDGDSLPDGWESSYGIDPLNPLGIHGATGDFDEDGFTNVSEMEGGSSPADVASFPRAIPQFKVLFPAESSVLLIEGDSLRFSVDTFMQTNASISYEWKLNGATVSRDSSWIFVTNDESSGMTTVSSDYSVEVVAASGMAVVSHTWQVTVRNRNRAPVLRLPSTNQVKVGEWVHLKPEFYDPDNQNQVPGDDNELSISFSGWMDQADRLTTTGDLGVHEVNVIVTDNGHPPLTAESTVRIIVESDSRNGSPFRISSVQLLADGAIQLFLEPPSERKLSIESSSNLIDWTEITYQLMDDGSIIVSGFEGTTEQFFRAKILE